MNALYDFYDVNNAGKTCTVYSPIGQEEWESELKRRLETEKVRKELPVYYYRIYRRCVFSLPVVNGWQHTLPVQYQRLNPYPWDTWLMWSLRERWDTLFAGAALYKDCAAASLLQTELDAAFTWETYSIGEEAGLGTAHFAMCVSRYLKGEIFSEEIRDHFKSLSREFLDKNFLPWFRKFAKEDHSNTVTFLHNINVIIVFSGLSLALESGHPCVAEISEIAERMIHLFTGARQKEVPHTEMAAYDAFALDAMTECWEGNGTYTEYADKCRADFEDVLHCFIDTAVPGRGDLLAPLGDVEPEMQYHSLVMLRISKWLKSEEGTHAFCMIPAGRLPTLAILDALRGSVKAPVAGEECDYTRRSAGSVVLRTGKGADALMCAVSIATCPAHHTHFDAGSFVFASRGSFIVTDPGYQQYMEGDERQFTIGTYAHNAPVINGEAQKEHKCKIIEISNGYVLLDLTECYNNLSEKAAVLRAIYLDGAARTLTVTDTFKNLGGAKIEHSFTIYPDFAVTVNKNDVCLTDGNVSAHMTSSIPFEPENAVCLPGSRGRLRLMHSQKLNTNGEERITFTISVVK